MKGQVVGNASEVRVEVLNASGSVVDFDTASVDATTRRFTAGMNRILSSGQSVRVVALLNGDPVYEGDDYTLVRSVLFDWGRVRAYFTLGTTLAKQTTSNGQGTEFSSAEIFSGLNVDYNWYTTLKDRAAAACPRPARVKDDLARAIRIVDDAGDVLDDARKGRLYKAFKDAFKKNDQDLKATGEAQAKSVKDAAKTKDASALNQHRSDSDTAGRENSSSLCSATPVDTRRLPELLSRIEDADPNQGRKHADAISKVALAAASVLNHFCELEPQCSTPWNLNERIAIAALKRQLERLQSVPLNVQPILWALSITDEIEIVLQDLRGADIDYLPGGWMVNTSFEGRLSQAPVS